MAARLAWPPHRDSYSQHGEDAAIESLLSHGTGIYLDIGSGNPVHLSNTYGLYRRGWTGTLIDPLWVNTALSRVLRPRDKVIRAVASSDSGTVDFYEFDPSVYSTVEPTVVQQVLESGAALERVSRLERVPVRELGFRATPAEPSLISLDVEGHELSVLESIDWDLQSPQIVLAELWGSCDREAHNGAVLSLLHDVGYSPVAYCGSDNLILKHSSSG